MYELDTKLILNLGRQAGNSQLYCKLIHPLMKTNRTSNFYIAREGNTMQIRLLGRIKSIYDDVVDVFRTK